MTMDKFCVGQSAESETEVTIGLTINRMGLDGSDVLSTPSLLALMEQCCIVSSEPSLPVGYTTVGYAVDAMRHMAPTSVGAIVKVRCVLTAVDRNRLTYDIEAFEGDKQIGVANHKRAVIPIN